MGLGTKQKQCAKGVRLPIDGRVSEGKGKGVRKPTETGHQPV